MIYFKSTMEEGGTKVTIYTPENSANVLRFSYVEETIPLENGETELKEWLGIEYSSIVEQSYPMPLKVLKRIKQTKTEEYFYVEEIVKLKQPLMLKVADKDEITRLLNSLERNVI